MQSSTTIFLFLATAPIVRSRAATARFRRGPRQPLSLRLQGQPPRRFVYKDYGSLVSLSYSSVGNLMGNLLGSVMIEGKLARLTYLSLYKKHQLALHGPTWVALASLINLMRLRTEPRLKLH